MDSLDFSYNISLAYKINDYCSVMLGLIGNFTLLYLIIKKTPKEMSDYRKILLQICFVDLFYNFGVFLAAPIIDFRHGIEIIYCNGLIPIYSKNMSWAFSAIWLFGLINSICNIPAPFVYRYFYLVKNKKLTGFSYMILLAVPITWNVIYVGIKSYLNYPNREAMSIVEQEFGTNFVNDINRIALVGLASSPGAWLIVFDGLLYSVLCLSTVTWCTIKIRAHLKQYLHCASHATKDMSSQLNWALMAQAISLLSASVIPLLTTIYTKIMKDDAVNSIALAMLIFSWIPWINPLLTIWFVKPYRNALFCRKNVQVQQAVATENGAHHIYKI